VQCIAIGMNRPGPRLDGQRGGSDLPFPHHELSAARRDAHRPVALRRGVRAGRHGPDGEKWSKSRGNLIAVSRLREAGVATGALRLALLSRHYREDREWTDAMLHEGEARLPGGARRLPGSRRRRGSDCSTTSGPAGVMERSCKSGGTAACCSRERRRGSSVPATANRVARAPSAALLPPPAASAGRGNRLRQAPTEHGLQALTAQGGHQRRGDAHPVRRTARTVQVSADDGSDDQQRCRDEGDAEDASGVGEGVDDQRGAGAGAQRQLVQQRGEQDRPCAAPGVTEDGLAGPSPGAAGRC